MERAQGMCGEAAAWQGRGYGGGQWEPVSLAQPQGAGRERSCGDPTRCRMRRGKARGGRGTPQPSCGNPARGFLGWGLAGAAWMSAARENPAAGFRAAAASCKHGRGRGRRARGLALPVLPVPAGLQEFGLRPCSPGLVAKQCPASTPMSCARTSPQPHGAGPAAPCGHIQPRRGAWWAQGGAGLRVPAGSSVCRGGTVGVGVRRVVGVCVPAGEGALRVHRVTARPCALRAVGAGVGAHGRVCVPGHACSAACWVWGVRACRHAHRHGGGPVCVQGSRHACACSQG